MIFKLVAEKFCQELNLLLFYLVSFENLSYNQDSFLPILNVTVQEERLQIFNQLKQSYLFGLNY